MNRFLADGLAALNALLAILIVLTSTIAGAAYEGGLLGGIGGAVAGFCIALFVCGALAVALDIRSNLIEIRQSLATKPEPQPKNRA